MKCFEIHDVTTNEVLADNLEFKEIPKLVGAYTDLYPTHEITVYNRTDNAIQTRHMSTRYANFKSEWLTFIEEYLCNIY